MTDFTLADVLKGKATLTDGHKESLYDLLSHRKREDTKKAIYRTIFSEYFPKNIAKSGNWFTNRISFSTYTNYGTSYVDSCTYYAGQDYPSEIKEIIKYFK